MTDKTKKALVVALLAAVLAAAKVLGCDPEKAAEPTGAAIVIHLPDVAISADATATALPDAVTP